MPPKAKKRSKRKHLTREDLRQKARRKNARAQSERFESELNNPPRSMVFRRGIVGEQVRELVHNLRAVMSPFSAMKLRETNKNQLRDFLNAAPPLGVTHFMILTQTPSGVGLRVARLPRGPTLTFRVVNYTTTKAIQTAQKTPHALNGPEFLTSPLVVLNNFAGEEDHKKIMAAVFQNMFPGLDITKLKLSQCRRVVLFNYNADTDTVDFRHYLISAVPVGLTRGIRKVIKGQIPARLGDREDIADWVENPNTLSDSEAELPEDARVTLAHEFAGRGNKAAGTSAIKLKELGPRMTLQLYKIEEGVCDGQVVYHRYVTKTEDEQLELAERKERERAEKAQRRAVQEANVLRKQQAAEARAKEKEERRAAKRAEAEAKGIKYEGSDSEDGNDEVDDDDEDYERHNQIKRERARAAGLAYADDYDEDEDDSEGEGGDAEDGEADLGDIGHDDEMEQSADDDDDDDDQEEEDGSDDDQDEEEEEEVVARVKKSKK